MKKKITALSLAVLIIACALTVANCTGDRNYTDVSYANMISCGAEETASTTMSLNDFVGGKVDSVTNLGGIISDVSDIGNSLGGLLGGGGSGLGDAVGGIGDALGGLLGGGSGGSSILGTTAPVTYDVNTETMGYIDIVPAVSDFATTLAPSTTQEAVVNETVDFAATKNPYTKPTTVLKGGDKGDGVKWMQWIFIYTRYGLKDDGITGVFDEDTMAVVKKVQRDNGLPVDGVVNDAVVDKIELLYFQSIYSTTVPALSTQVQTTQDVIIQQEEKDDTTEKSSVIVLLVIVIVLWVAVVAFIVVLFVSKKKKTKKAKASEDKTNADTSAEDLQKSE